MNDWSLLQEYNSGGTNTAFAELVQRHIGMVYAAALRQVRDPHAAKVEFESLAGFSIPTQAPQLTGPARPST